MTRYIVTTIAEARASGKRAAGFASKATAKRWAEELNAGTRSQRTVSWIARSFAHGAAIVDTAIAADESPTPKRRPATKRQTLADDLADLERTDPAVRKASDNYDATVQGLVARANRTPSAKWRESSPGAFTLSVPIVGCLRVMSTLPKGEGRWWVAGNIEGLSWDREFDTADEAKFACEDAAARLLLAALADARRLMAAALAGK